MAGWTARQGRDKCRIKIERLQELGFELRRAEADLLRDGIYELRVSLRRANFRILYFFHRKEFLADPRAHTYAEG